MLNMFFKLAWQSLLYRRGSVLVTVAAIAVSVFTLLGTEHIRLAAKQSFSSTVSGVDLIVGPRTSEVNLLLTSVFRIGQASQNMSWQSYQYLKNHTNVAWTIPISLGDSHKNFRVVGTEKQFFTRFHYGQSRPLAFSQGKAFDGHYDVVLGAQAAQQLRYTLGHKLILSHGLGNTSFQKHTAFPFTVSGILEPTGTPVDNALYVSLTGMELIHQAPGKKHNPNNIEPTSITAAMVGLSSKLATFKVQRELNTATQEPLTAILPGVALSQLWQMSKGLEKTLQLMTQLILLASLLGLGAMMLASLRERSYEISVLRTLGAGSFTISLLIQLESLFVALMGIIIGSAAFAVLVSLASSMVAVKYGIDLSLSRLTASHGFILLYVVSGAVITGAIPAFISFWRSVFLSYAK